MKKVTFIVFMILILILIPVCIFFLSALKTLKVDKNAEPPNNNTTQKQEKIEILSVTPANNATNIYPGEIEISFTTNAPILSKNNFSIEVSPPLDHPLQITSAFPTTTVKADVLGGLKTNTVYSVNIRDGQNNTIASWSFTTAPTPAENSTGLVNQRDEKTIKDFYPLASFLPYQTTDYRIDYYEDHLKLKVTILTSDTSRAKNELYSWIKSKGIDPNTHTYDFVTGF